VFNLEQTPMIPSWIMRHGAASIDTFPYADHRAASVPHMRDANVARFHWGRGANSR